MVQGVWWLQTSVAEAKAEAEAEVLKLLRRSMAKRSVGSIDSLSNWSTALGATIRGCSF